MKKILLLAVAALMVGTANAQLLKKQNAGKPQAKHQMMHKATLHKSPVLGVKANVKATVDKSCKTMTLTAAQKQALKPVANNFKQASFRRAAEVQALYNGTGTLRSAQAATAWDMEAGTATVEGQSVTVLKNVIPNIFGFDNGVVVQYTVNDGKIIIAPQLVASYPDEQAPTGTYYLFLEDASSSDGKITLTMDDDGSISGTYNIIYSIYPAKTYNYADWVATYDGVTGAQYTLPGVIKAPVVSFQQSNLVLFAGLGLNFYSYNSNLAMTGAFATTNFTNLTKNTATGWNWSAMDASTEEETVFASGTEKNFAIPAETGAYYNVQLIGNNQDKVSDPFLFGAGKSKNDDGTARYDECLIYAGNSQSSFILNNETPAIMTRYDLDCDLVAYTNWATPDVYSTSMSKIFNLFEKPAAPLYISGVTLPLYKFSELDPEGNPFNLHIKICKVDRTDGKIRPGDVIAEGDATKENVNDAFASSSNLTGIEFSELYVEDEFGMASSIPYLFLDDEFFIVVEGWDNGSFSGRFLSQDNPLEDAATSTWFEKTGEEGKMYAYTSWKTALFIGLMDATYGYLYTEDDTNLVIPEVGGEASIHVYPMFSNGEEAAAELGYKTRLFLDETVEGNEIPEWLQIGIANEEYTEEEYAFDLIAQAEALPAGVEGRQATIVFYQEGARLTVTVTQGTVSGISSTKATVKVEKATPMYNLAGQRVNSNFKGLVVKDGKKYVVK